MLGCKGEIRAGATVAACVALPAHPATVLSHSEPRGEPAVSNGLALCSLHHAAFDRHILGIRPDLVVEIRSDILEEEDGPMLIHGLQSFQDHRILIPRSPIHHPNRDFLAERYELFRKAS